MPLSRMENTTFAMPSIIDSHDMRLRTVYIPDARKKTPIQRLFSYGGIFGDFCQNLKSMTILQSLEVYMKRLWWCDIYMNDRFGVIGKVLAFVRNGRYPERTFLPSLDVIWTRNLRAAVVAPSIHRRSNQTVKH
ncbi:hypothetical protein TNCV_2466501 [Trichonephila clavipes]|nr:hypothetical protein TNCV_2466501 [Trichonephila clavipes]